MNIYLKKTVIRTSFDTLVSQLKTELDREGFVLSEDTNFQQIFFDRLNLHYRKCKILHASIPHLYHEMLTIEPFEGIILPCQITVAEDSPGEVIVVPVNPTELIARSIQSPSLQNLSEEVSRRLNVVIQALEKKSTSSPDLVTSWE